MGIEEIEGEALSLDPKERARLAGKLLESLENLSDAENAELWAEEAERRDAELDRDPEQGQTAGEVFREVRRELK